jgi:hypothetical protein
MKSEREAGNYTLLQYVEPDGHQRLVAGFVLEKALAPDAYAQLTDPAKVAQWCATSTTEDGRLQMTLPGAPVPLELVSSRPHDSAEYAAHHDPGESSRVVLTISPATYHTILIVSHRGIPAADAPAWARFWSGPVFLLLGDTLEHRNSLARPVLVDR